MKYILAYDLGTGGVKASIFDIDAVSCASSFIEYSTYYRNNGIHEQKPGDWWDGIVAATKDLLKKSGINSLDIKCIALSGHSLGVVAVDKNGSLLSEYTPIWSDSRAQKQAAEFFQKIDYNNWYLKTGNGFPAYLYSIFKIMWYKESQPELYNKTNKFIGTKDYINFRLTGKICTDFSYASGSGVYDLESGKYDQLLISASGIDEAKLPEIYPSTEIIGTLQQASSQQLGLHRDVKVVCGGVDNSCMALGANCYAEGTSYTSLGSSAWITVSSEKPVTVLQKKPYIFAHCVPGKFISSTSIFSAGRSLKWVKDNVFADISKERNDPYTFLDELSEQSPVGANKLIFNPSLSGGSGIDKSPKIKGGFIGLELRHTRADIIRSVLEGIALNMRMALDVLKSCTKLSNQMLIVGGGAKSNVWRQIFADAYNMEVIKTDIDQDAASLGAAALAAVGCGLWDDYSQIEKAHSDKQVKQPISENSTKYEALLSLFIKISDIQSDIGDILDELSI